jgi:hypothetical protein
MTTGCLELACECIIIPRAPRSQTGRAEWPASKINCTLERTCQHNIPSVVNHNASYGIDSRIYRGEVKSSIEETTQMEVRIAMRSDLQKSFEPIPVRWIIERTLGWLNRYRLLPDSGARRIEKPRRKAA